MSYCHVQVEVEKVQRSFEHSHMVQWLEKTVIDNVKKEEASALSLFPFPSLTDSLSLTHTHTHITGCKYNAVYIRPKEAGYNVNFELSLL